MRYAGEHQNDELEIVDEDEEDLFVPDAVKWCKLYLAIFFLVYLASAGFALYLVSRHHAGNVFSGLFLLLLSIPLCLSHAIPFFVAPRPWVWMFVLVLICLGLTIPCTLPATVPLLLTWLRPEAKRYYGKL